MDQKVSLIKLFSKWRKKRKAYQADELDKKLFTTISNLYPRPKFIDYCDYDVSENAMLELCNNVNVAYEDPELVESYIFNSRLGFFGDWPDFPAFAADVAIVARREDIDESNLIYWYFHTSKHGIFPKSIYPLLLDWASDILLPWKINIKRTKLMYDYWGMEHIGLLGIYINLGGDPLHVMREHIDYSATQQQATSLLRAINENYIPTKKEIFKHFRAFNRYISQQNTLPPYVKRLMPVINIKRIISMIETNRAEIKDICEKYPFDILKHPF